MKLFFLDGNEEWCSIARMLGYDVGFVPLEDVRTNVLFVPEYIPVSHIRRTFKNSTIVVVWKDYELGVIENTRHDINVVTDNKIVVGGIQSASWIPEGVNDIFSVVKTVSHPNDRTLVIENDDELVCKTTFERAHIFKFAKAYHGKRYTKEAYMAGCDVVVTNPFVVETKEIVAKQLYDFLEKLKIFVNINSSNDSQTT